MIAYVDTSVPLRVLLGQPGRLRQWGRWERGYTSELTGVEMRRVLDRLRIAGALGDEELGTAQESCARIESGLGRVDVSRIVLQRAGLPMPTAVKTLDALHLVSALILQERIDERLVFATHDIQQAVAARALGLSCIGVPKRSAGA